MSRTSKSNSVAVLPKAKTRREKDRPVRLLIKGRFATEFEQAIAEDTYVGMILEYVNDRLRGPLLRKIRALQRAAQIASACEDYAINGKSAPL